MKRAAAILLALTACAGGAHDVVGSSAMPPARGPDPTTTIAGLATSPGEGGPANGGAHPPEGPPASIFPEPVGEGGAAAGTSGRGWTCAPPDCSAGSGSGTSTTIPASSIARGPLPVNLGGTTAASWYGDELRGSPTASGEPFDPDDLTTAHRSLPFGTRVSVCHSGCVVVRVNDRGPFVGGRSFDLSRAAFAVIAPLGAGVVPVSWEVVG